MTSREKALLSPCRLLKVGGGLVALFCQALMILKCGLSVKWVRLVFVTPLRVAFRVLFVFGRSSLSGQDGLTLAYGRFAQPSTFGRTP